MHRAKTLLVALSALVALPCCSSDDAGGAAPAGSPAPMPLPEAVAGTHVAFDWGADLSQPEHFYDAPYPSDLRLTPTGAPDLGGLPVPQNALGLVGGLKKAAAERKGFPALPIAYFHFDGPLKPRAVDEVVPAAFDSPVVLVDVDEASPDRGGLTPTVAVTLTSDDYVPEDVLAVAARPGFVLHPGRKYAFVVFREQGDASGALLGVDAATGALARGLTPAGPRGAEQAALYAPLAKTLADKGVDPARVAAATVFTTGDVVADTFALSERVKAKHTVEIKGLAIDPDDGAAHPGYCELNGTVDYPQFQKGTPPFDKEGLFELDADGQPAVQRSETARVTLTIPKNLPVPAKGLPLVLYLHGSGGDPDEAVDASRKPTKEDEGPKGEGPASFMAPYGMAMLATSLPFSLNRYPSGNEQSYLNVNNLAAFRDTFRQGILEQRMLLEAARTLRIPAEVLAGCAGVQLPAGATDVGFDPEALFAMGQSMGGAYTNYLGGIEPRVKAVVPTGAGGFWSSFVLTTTVIPNASGVIGLVLATKAKLSFAHPALHLLETAWEPIDPLVYAPRVARRPLPDQPVRPIYEPVGKGDRYFSIEVYDTMALAYGNNQAGDVVWPSLQAALSLDGRTGVVPYPVTQNAKSEGGLPFTGVVAAYEGDGIADPHAIYRQLDGVKHQYGCFLSTFAATGVAVVPAPGPIGSPCTP
jgi:hypothetical protein